MECLAGLASETNVFSVEALKRRLRGGFLHKGNLKERASGDIDVVGSGLDIGFTKLGLAQ